MEEFAAKILHRDVQFVPYEQVNLLPLALRGTYAFFWLVIGENRSLAAEPHEQVPLSELRKQHRQIEILTGLRCVLLLQNMTYYARDALIREGIPFIWENHQIYLPDFGVLLDAQQRKKPLPCARLSFLTQKLLLSSLYHGWEKVTVTEAAKRLNISKMSITRSFDELEAWNIPYLEVKNRARKFTADSDKRAMWEQIRGILRTPVLTTYPLKEVPEKHFPLSGLSALSHYSMLDEPACPAIAVTKKELPLIDLSPDRLSGPGETPACIVQEVGYRIPFEQEDAVDPLSLVLSLTGEERQEVRISRAADEMLETYVWQISQ